MSKQEASKAKLANKRTPKRTITNQELKQKLSSSDEGIDQFIAGASESPSTQAINPDKPWLLLDPDQNRNPKNPKSLTLNDYERCLIKKAATKLGIPEATFVRMCVIQRSKELLAID